MKSNGVVKGWSQFHVFKQILVNKYLVYTKFKNLQKTPFLSQKGCAVYILHFNICFLL